MGRFIATAPLDALKGQAIVSFQAWSDKDEAKARCIMKQAAAHAGGKVLPSLPGDVNAAHLLAGATMAVYQEPAHFDDITEYLNAGLDMRYRANAARFA